MDYMSLADHLLHRHPHQITQIGQPIPGVRPGTLPRRRTPITAPHFFQTKNEIVHQATTFLLHLVPLDTLVNPPGRNASILTNSDSFPPPSIRRRRLRAEIPHCRPTIIKHVRFNNASLSVPDHDGKAGSITMKGSGGRHILPNIPHLSIPGQSPLHCWGHRIQTKA